MVLPEGLRLRPLALALALLAVPAAQARAEAVAAPMAAATAEVDYESYLLQVRYRGETLGDLLPALIPLPGQPPLTKNGNGNGNGNSNGNGAEAAWPALYQAEDLLAALGVLAAWRDDGALAGVVPGSEAAFAFWPDGRYAVGRESGRLPPLFYRVEHGELYLSPQALARARPTRRRSWRPSPTRGWGGRWATYACAPTVRSATAATAWPGMAWWRPSWAGRRR